MYFSHWLDTMKQQNSEQAANVLFIKHQFNGQCTERFKTAFKMQWLIVTFSINCIHIYEPEVYGELNDDDVTAAALTLSVDDLLQVVTSPSSDVRQWNYTSETSAVTMRVIGSRRGRMSTGNRISDRCATTFSLVVEYRAVGEFGVVYILVAR